MNNENTKSLYLGNLNYDVTIEDLQSIFHNYGEVKDIKLIQKKGIAFVSLENQDDAALAMKSLDGIDFLGRKLIIDWARPRKKHIIGAESPLEA